jgi:hypothetical protein
MANTKIRNGQIEDKTITVDKVADESAFLTDDWDLVTGADDHRVKVDDPLADEDVSNKGYTDSVAFGTIEVFVPTPGQTTFTLLGVPTHPEFSIVKINGLPLIYSREYIITSNQVILQVGSNPDQLNYVVSNTDFVEIIWI